jgi:hypothetical protein
LEVPSDTDLDVSNVRPKWTLGRLHFV